MGLAVKSCFILNVKEERKNRLTKKKEKNDMKTLLLFLF
jgi:hypothetical protein